MYLKPQARNLPYEDIQMIFLLNERTLMNMVPNKVELHILKDPKNKAWMMRPEARLPNLESQLSSYTHDPNKLAEILNDVKEKTEIEECEDQSLSLIQELMRESTEFAIAMIKMDSNIPKGGEFSYDLNLRSPFCACFEKKFVKTSVEKLLNYFQKQPHSFYNQQLIMMSFQQLGNCERLDGFNFFMTDFDENGESKNEFPKIAHFLQKS